AGRRTGSRARPRRPARLVVPGVPAGGAAAAMIVAAAAAVAAAAGGLCCVRTATPVARWLAWGVVLAFAAIAFAAPAFAWRRQDARTAAVTLAGEPRAMAGDL